MLPSSVDKSAVIINADPEPAPRRLSVVLPSLPKASGFPVLRLPLLERGSRAALVTQRGDGAFLKFGFGFGQINGGVRLTPTFCLRQLQIHLLTANRGNRSVRLEQATAVSPVVSSLMRSGFYV